MKIFGWLLLLSLFAVLFWQTPDTKINFGNAINYTDKNTGELFQSKPVAERFGEDINVQFLSQTTQWIHRIPVIILCLFALGFLYILIIAVMDYLKTMMGLYAILLLVSALELFYFLWLGGDTWFCSPSDVGWLMTIVNFILYAALIIGQYKAFEFLGGAITKRSVFGGYSVGIVTAAIGVGLLLLQSFFWKDIAVLQTIASVIIIGGQVVQLVINMFRRGVLYGLIISAIYLVCFSALLLILLHFLKLLLIVFLVYCFFAALADNSKTPAASSSGSGGGGSWGWAKNCAHFDTGSMMCNRGYKHECGLYQSGRCQHGQM